MELENNVEFYRNKLNFSRSELAEKLGCSRQSVRNIENGVYAPSILISMKIARAFKTEFENVFWLKKKPEETE
jgi:putative transcriptional regulator